MIATFTHRNTMWMQCAFCGNADDVLLHSESNVLTCCKCEARLKSLQRSFHRNDSIAAIFNYESPISKIIHRAKIRDDIPALSTIAKIVAFSEQCAVFGNWATVVTPAPSSLWGRIRGRYDIASVCAHLIAATSGRPVVDSPGNLYWLIKKRAQRNSEERLFEYTEPILDIGACHTKKPMTRVLIVDDVFTTGATVASVKRAISKTNPAAEFKVLTLATTGNSDQLLNHLKIR